MITKAPLCNSQYGIYAECAAHIGEPFYNLPYVHVLDNSLDGTRLKKAVHTAVLNHPTLFTRININEEGDPIQTIDDSETLSLEIEQGTLNFKEQTFNGKQLVVPFDLYGGRLFNIRILRDDQNLYLFIDIHHIICDGTSLNIILNDIDKAYKGEELLPEALTMADVSIAEEELRKTDAFDQGKKWYEQNFDCGDCFTQIMPDIEQNEHSEDSLLRILDVDLDKVEDFCKKNGVFKSNLFNMAYSFLLAKFNNEQESLYTTVYNGRKDKRLCNSVAMTVKTLPVYAKFDNQTKVIDYLKAGQEQMSGVRNHEAYSFSDVVDDIGIQSNSMFVWHGMIFSKDQMGGMPMKTIRLGNSTLEASLYLKTFILKGKCCVKAEYNSNEYSEILISQVLESYEKVVEEFLNKEYLRDVDLTTQEQIETLDKFNMNDADYDDTQTIVSLFRNQVKQTPNNIAVVYQDKKYSYAQVDEMSDRIAAFIATKGLATEDVVSILIPRCEWMAIASIGVLKAGCAYQPLDPSYPKERLNFMMKDANAKLLIADRQLRDLVDEYQGEVMLTENLNNLKDNTPGMAPDIEPQDLFILLYTSGSTGIPKGCQLTHANIVAFCNWYHNFYDLKPEHNVAAYASFGFDACMMDLYPALTCGATVHIVPEDIRLDLIALNEYFETNEITHSFMTTQVGFQFASNVENKSLMYLSTGGEKLASITPPIGYKFYNVYGPTECTIFTTTYLVDKKMKDIPIGKPLDNMKLYIVDQQGKRLPVGAAGELWVSGPQVSRGYLNRPEKTNEVYINNPFNKDKKYERIYRSGDIVRYLPSGDIQFVGRRDGQVKIRGFRIELKEVETVIREFNGIKDATVQAFDEEGGNGKFIAAYIVSDKTIDIEELNNFILDQKPPYMIPAVTMQIDAIPLNQNQKVNKRALPKPEKKAMVVEDYNVPMNVLETELHDLIAGVVNTKEFGITTVLGYVGLTSISAIKLAVLINKQYGITLDSKKLVKNGSLQSIENDILKAMLKQQTPNEENKKTEKQSLKSAPLSYAQTGVYFDCLKNPTSTIYNIPYLLSYPDGVEADKLVEAVKMAVEAHSEFGVHFAIEGDAIIQTLEQAVEVEVPVIEIKDEELATYKNEFVRPFNLQKPPLYRFEVVKTQSGVKLLMDVHHLIFDGGSADLFIRQIGQLLEYKTIDKENYSYLDFVDEQQKAQESETFRKAQDFFAEKLKDFESASEIPADLQKSDRQGLIGEAVAKVDFDKLTSFCRMMEITPAHLFLAATSYVISRYTNSRNVYISTISSGRANLKIADTVGMFVNTLVLGIKVEDVTVAEYLRMVSETFDQTLSHEEYPFAKIAADFGFRPAIAFAYQVGVLSPYTVNGKPVRQELLELNVPKFKINIKIESIGVVVQFDDSIYSQRLGNDLAESIAAVAMRMAELYQQKVRKISIVSKSQEEELEKLRQVATGTPKFRFYHEFIEYYANTQPDKKAIVATDATLSFKEFNGLANRIANALCARGVSNRSRVAILLPRTSRVMISIFGVMKAGCAYIPCDPEYPTDRIQHIINDSHAAYIITTADRVEQFPNAIDVESLLECQDDNYHSAEITPKDLCYLIYTSGSTGKPKGVMLRHESIVNYLHDHTANVHIHAIAQTVKALVCVTTLSFDMSIKEFGGALSQGKTLVLANEEQTTNPALLAQLMKDNDVDAINATPSRMMQYLELPAFVDAVSSCKVIMCGGEKYADGLLDKLRMIATEARIFNTYGPTEITVSSNGKDLTNTNIVTVGKPLLNYKEFVVDADGNELPVGVVGELYIGGIGVASGYNDLPEMTEERFIVYKDTRVYRSGDFARWTPEGDVVILGRTDNQIKLRGLRIELGEVEAALNAVEGMKNVVVKITKIKNNEHLCAYFTANHKIDIVKLKEKLGMTLTKYMVPTAYLQLDKMPITPNGKTDIKALPEPQLAISGDYEKPANKMESDFCDIFADILQMDRVGANDNFFELGGTSLVVTRVIIEADKIGLHVSYGDVFDNPTPRQLANLINGDGEKQQAESENDNIKSFDYTNIDNLLKLNNLKTFRYGQRMKLGNVLLTGATGYLGIHILKELIDSNAENIYCLVRGKNKEAAESRLRTLLFYYFSDSFKDVFGKRLNVLVGDVTQDLTAICMKHGADNIDTLFNCAAVVKHFAEGTEIEDVNIGGAQRCLEFCAKTGAKLIHVSTASTRGLWAGENKDDVFTEQRLYIGQYLGNQYIHSKFLAERLILNAVAENKLCAKIMRVGNLAARSTDGEFQANFATNSFMGRIRIYNMLGCCPYAMRNKKVEFSPINEVSKAIVLLATTPKECTVFHPYNIHGQFLGDVLLGLNSIGNKINFVEQEDFQKAFDEAGQDPQKAKHMAALIAYKDMAHGLKTTDVQRDNDYTTQVLYRLGFAFSPTSWDYVERMLTVIGGFGFFE